MANYKLDPDVVDVLSRATCDETSLFLPPEQLDRKLYERVNKALSNAGGTWNKKTRSHIFPSAAAPKLAAMLGSGIAVDEKKRDQAFFSPPEVALAAVRLADVRHKVVLEPNAGPGALVSACNVAGALAVHCIEINPLYEPDLKRIATSVRIADFLQCVPKPFHDRVVMNPPFTRDQDVVHVRHALRFLKPQGVLVSVMFGNQDRRRLQELRSQYRPRVIELPRGAFKESGTDIPTLLVRIDLPK